jgi:DNA polymerase-1
MKKNKIVLLDAHAIIHRAYHALPDFQTREGKATGALYGLSAMIISIVDQLKPDYLIACYDLPKPTFRHHAYEEYKGTRKKTDESLVEQLKESFDIFDAFNIQTFSKEGYEADDILGTFAEKYKKDKNNEIIIASGDMDILQLVDENVKVYSFKKGVKDTIIYDKKAVEEKMGFGPEFITDYKGLAGDSSDNIPGIPGVGAKTATTLIKNFGRIENIYKKLEENEESFLEIKITKRIISLLKEYKEEAFFSKELATIKRDVEIDEPKLEKTFLENLDLSKTAEIFRKLEFRALNDRLKKAIGVETEKDEINKSEIKIDEKKLKELKLAISILNPNITNPSLDDILKFEKK